MIVNYVPVFHATVLPVHSGNVNDYIYMCPPLAACHVHYMYTVLVRVP